MNTTDNEEFNLSKEKDPVTDIHHDNQVRQVLV